MRVCSLICLYFIVPRGLNGRPNSSSRPLRPILASGAAACLIWFGATTASDFWSGYKRVLSWRDAPLYEAYDVESAPATIADAALWVGVVVQSPTAFAFERADWSAGWYLSAYDAGAHLVALSAPKSKAAVGALNYSRPDGSHVRLDGTIAASGYRSCSGQPPRHASGS
jgi:hypothetical protein